MRGFSSDLSDVLSVREIALPTDGRTTCCFKLTKKTGLTWLQAPVTEDNCCLCNRRKLYFVIIWSWTDINKEKVTATIGSRNWISKMEIGNKNNKSVFLNLQQKRCLEILIQVAFKTLIAHFENISKLGYWYYLKRRVVNSFLFF